MSKNTGRSVVGTVLICLFAVVIAAMIFPTAIYYKGALGGSDKVWGIYNVFGGYRMKSLNNAYTNVNVVALIGFLLPLIGAVLFVVAPRVKALPFITVACFLASFILLFCNKLGFCAANGSVASTNYSNGVGPIIGAIVGIVGFVTSLVFAIKRLISQN